MQTISKLFMNDPLYFIYGMPHWNSYAWLMVIVTDSSVCFHELKEGRVGVCGTLPESGGGGWDPPWKKFGGWGVGPSLKEDGGWGTLLYVITLRYNLQGRFLS